MLPVNSPRLILAAVLLFTAGHASAAESPFLRHALEGFDQWDANKDGSLSIGEIETAIASPAVVREKAAAAVALRRVAKNKKNPVNAYSKDDIKRMTGAVVEDTRDTEENPDNDNRPGGFEKYYDAALKRITTTRRELIVGGAPKLDEFKQGRLGSCFCLAPLSALVYADPKAAANLFKVSPDGEFVTVTFGKDTPVKVSRVTDGEIALASGTGQNGVWSATYEKAVGQLRSAGKADESSPTPLSVVSRGGSAGSMLSVLTGNEIERFSCKPWFEGANTPKAELDKKLVELRTLLRTSIAQKKLMTAGTSGKTRKVPSLSRGHAYAVIGYDAKTDMVTIRDPHCQDFKPKGAPGLENGYVVKQGIFKAPLFEVTQFMAGFAFEQNTRSKGKGYVNYTAATD
jgi:hypothetical protein